MDTYLKQFVYLTDETDIASFERMTIAIKYVRFHILQNLWHFNFMLSLTFLSFDRTYAYVLLSKVVYASRKPWLSLVFVREPMIFDET